MKDLEKNVWKLKPMRFPINQCDSSRSTSSISLSDSEYTKHVTAQANC